jgi:cysteinyl-tRNA synthetase
MAQKYLGDYFDIHCGGEDHIPVHHTNEIAQTEARVGTRPRELLDARLLPAVQRREDGEVAGEFLRLAYLVDRGYDPLAYRYLCLTAHYRGQLNFTWDALDAAASRARSDAAGRLRVREVDTEGDAVRADPALTERFTNEISDDLNIPRALAVAWETLRGDSPPASRRATLLHFDRFSDCGSRSGRRSRKSRPMP